VDVVENNVTKVIKLAKGLGLLNDFHPFKNTRHSVAWIIVNSKMSKVDKRLFILSAFCKGKIKKVQANKLLKALGIKEIMT
jgi:peptidyl-tRNA hydrolase